MLMKKGLDSKTIFEEEIKEEIENLIDELLLLTSAEIKVVILSSSSFLPKFTLASRKKTALKRTQKEFCRFKMNKEGKISVLILISLKENFVQIIASKNVDNIVPPETWYSAINAIISTIKTTRSHLGIQNAVITIANELCKYFPRKEEHSGLFPDNVFLK